MLLHREQLLHQQRNQAEQGSILLSLRLQRLQHSQVKQRDPRGPAKDPKASKALDCFGNAVTRQDEQTSSQLAAADVSSTKVVAGSKAAAVPSSAAAKATRETAVDARNAPHSKTYHQPDRSQQAAAFPAAQASTGENVLLSAAVQSSALYAQLTGVIATSEDVRMVSVPQALKAVAEGSQCIITGAVFEFLLEHAEPAVLETILAATVAYARMKAHQKAQAGEAVGQGRAADNLWPADSGMLLP